MIPGFWIVILLNVFGWGYFAISFILAFRERGKRQVRLIETRSISNLQRPNKSRILSNQNNDIALGVIASAVYLGVLFVQFYLVYSGMVELPGHDSGWFIIFLPVNTFVFPVIGSSLIGLGSEYWLLDEGVMDHSRFKGNLFFEWKSIDSVAYIESKDSDGGLHYKFEIRSGRFKMAFPIEMAGIGTLARFIYEKIPREKWVDLRRVEDALIVLHGSLQTRA